MQSLWFFFSFVWENRRGDKWRLRVRRMTWKLNWGCVVREKAGIWSVTNFSLTAKPKGLMGMGVELKFVWNVMCHTVSTTVFGYKPNTSRIGLWKEFNYIYAPSFYCYLLQKILEPPFIFATFAITGKSNQFICDTVIIRAVW